MEGIRKSLNPKILYLDTETALRWFWYDGKGTTRLQMFVGKWGRDGVPFSVVILPDINVDNMSEKYTSLGLPVMKRRDALLWIKGIIESADLIVGHNVKGFDWKVLMAEFILEGIVVPDMPPMRDSLKDMKATHGMSRSLANRLSRIPGAPAKVHVDPVIWEKAWNDYDPDAIAHVWHRCVTDDDGHVIVDDDNIRGNYYK